MASLRQVVRVSKQENSWYGTRVLGCGIACVQPCLYVAHRIHVSSTPCGESAVTTCVHVPVHCPVHMWACVHACV